jgi:hypothetical protein
VRFPALRAVDADFWGNFWSDRFILASPDFRYVQLIKLSPGWLRPGWVQIWTLGALPVFPLPGGVMFISLPGRWREWRNSHGAAPELSISTQDNYLLECAGQVFSSEQP